MGGMGIKNAPRLSTIQILSECYEQPCSVASCTYSDQVPKPLYTHHPELNMGGTNQQDSESRHTRSQESQTRKMHKQTFSDTPCTPCDIVRAAAGMKQQTPRSIKTTQILAEVITAERQA